MENLNSLTLAERINVLRKEEVFTPEVDEYLYLVRTTGNQAVHDILEGELIIALQFHKFIYKITAWFIETYIDYHFNAPIYKTPQPTPYITEIRDIPIKKVKNEVIEVPQSECLIEELSKLKESSREAVEGLSQCH